VDPPWFHCSPIDTPAITLPKSEARHAVQSLRLRAGDAACVFDGRGRVARGTLQISDDDSKAARRTKKRPPAVRVAVERIDEFARPQPALSIITAACKGSRLEWLVEKCTELGVAEIVLARFARSIVLPQQTDKLDRTALEACKQCGRAWLPTIRLGRDIGDEVAVQTEHTIVCADADPTAPLFGAWLVADRSRAAQDLRVTLIVGPEGGFTRDERAMFRERNIVNVCLSEQVLRIETAAVAAAAAWSAHGARRPEPKV
jgi:16S rRNA (uracil1498-N3)-methyltransferase